MQKPKVWKKGSAGIPANAVYVGRPSQWGNPFPMYNEQARDAVCNMYEYWIAQIGQAQLVQAMKAELKGKDLVCFCAPKRCHADTILRIANE